MLDRLVQFDATREPPADVLAALRQVDPRAEAVWWGLRAFPAKTRTGEDTQVWKPAWLVGLVYPDPKQFRQAMEGLELFAKAPEEKKAPNRIRLWDLKRQGFHPVMAWPSGVLDSGVVFDLAFRRWVRLHESELAERQALHDADTERGLERNIATMREINRAENPSIYRYVWKGRRSILVN